TVVMCDVDWNPHGGLQTTARAHRIGQTRPLLAYKLLASGLVEHKMLPTGRLKLI
ncbi:hypothetical protein BCR44DRAFT_104905, partial [Catenaria anguillulae PL171]